MARIELEQWPEPLSTKRGSILDAALAAGVPYPHGCRSGECGKCKSRLHAGEVAMDGCAAEALTDEERLNGLILACRARPRGDVSVSWLEAPAPTRVHAVRRLRGTVVQIEDATHDIKRLRVAVDAGIFEFSAGQYVELSFDGAPARPYSMASRPGDPLLEFHIRHLPGGATSGHVHRRLRVGAEAGIAGPYGSACLGEPSARPLLFIAGGAGLAPIKSMLAALAWEHDWPPIHLYHGVRDLPDLYDADAIQRLCGGRDLSYHPVLSMPSGPTDFRTGFVHEAVASDFRAPGAPDLADFAVYLCGPPPMVEAATAVVLRLGADPSRVHADAFHFAAGTPDGAVAQDRPRRSRWDFIRALFR